MKPNCSCHFDCINYGHCDIEENEDGTKVSDCEDCYREQDCDYCTRYYCEKMDDDD
jgi:hypothetical protein